MRKTRHLFHGTMRSRTPSEPWLDSIFITLPIDAPYARHLWCLLSWEAQYTSIGTHSVVARFVTERRIAAHKSSCEGACGQRRLLLLVDRSGARRFGP